MLARRLLLRPRALGARGFFFGPDDEEIKEFTDEAVLAVPKVARARSLADACALLDAAAGADAALPPPCAAAADWGAGLGQVQAWATEAWGSAPSGSPQAGRAALVAAFAKRAALYEELLEGDRGQLDALLAAAAAGSGEDRLQWYLRAFDGNRDGSLVESEVTMLGRHLVGASWEAVGRLAGGGRTELRDLADAGVDLPSRTRCLFFWADRTEEDPHLLTLGMLEGIRKDAFPEVNALCTLAGNELFRKAYAREVERATKVKGRWKGAAFVVAVTAADIGIRLL